MFTLLHKKAIALFLLLVLCLLQGFGCKNEKHKQVSAWCVSMQHLSDLFFVYKREFGSFPYNSKGTEFAIYEAFRKRRGKEYDYAYHVRIRNAPMLFKFNDEQRKVFDCFIEYANLPPEIQQEKSGEFVLCTCFVKEERELYVITSEFAVYMVRFDSEEEAKGNIPTLGGDIKFLEGNPRAELIQYSFFIPNYADKTKAIPSENDK